jgi:hypothetical protein
VGPVPAVPVARLHTRLDLATPLAWRPSPPDKPLTHWKMEIDDAPIFRYFYRHMRPRRHLEFGTWQGEGVLYCLEECDATVWTINLLHGEVRPDGTWAYGTSFSDPAAVPAWSNKVVYAQTWYQTDALGFIGWRYLQRGLGRRVCQVYCDSQEWDSSNYPDGFFDTALIDGSHSEEVVASDTRNACRLVRPGGLIFWHDYCPDPEVLASCSSVAGVMAAIDHNRAWLGTQVRDLFWVQPSWILVGVKR